MREGKEDDFDAEVFNQWPAEGLDWRQGLAPAECQLRVEVLETNAARGGLVGDTSEEERLR